MNQEKLGTLYGISVGTGDPELLTIKAVKTLQRCPIIAFPMGIKNRQGIAERIIQSYLQPQQQTLPLKFPYTQDENELQQAWLSVTGQIGDILQQGQDVGFACEGDISFYSTFTYVAQTLRKIQPTAKMEFIAGVSSPMAVANSLQIPLTTQNDKLLILPALYSVAELEKALDFADTVVLMKVASVYPQVWQILQKRNLWQSAWIVEKATSQQETIYYPLKNHPQLQLSYFSVLIIKI